MERKQGKFLLCFYFYFYYPHFPPKGKKTKNKEEQTNKTLIPSVFIAATLTALTLYIFTQVALRELTNQMKETASALTVRQTACQIKNGQVVSAKIHSTEQPERSCLKSVQVTMGNL